LFWLDNGVVCTPPLAVGALDGVTRAVVLELCRSRGVNTEFKCIGLEDFRRKSGIFLTSSVAGVVPATSLDGRPLAPSPMIVQLQGAYEVLVRREAGVE
jgi:branched-subunit amino acid aminotransferase/4-amino-4-deoxychorismate lyase